MGEALRDSSQSLAEVDDGIGRQRAPARWYERVAIGTNTTINTIVQIIE